jgi:hypothetical protein
MPDRTPPRSGMLAAYFDFTAKHYSKGARNEVCVRVNGEQSGCGFGQSIVFG